MHGRPNPSGGTRSAQEGLVGKLPPAGGKRARGEEKRREGKRKRERERENTKREARERTEERRKKRKHARDKNECRR